jgi:hypothetical protein
MSEYGTPFSLGLVEPYLKIKITSIIQLPSYEENVVNIMSDSCPKFLFSIP